MNKNLTNIDKLDLMMKEKYNAKKLNVEEALKCYPYRIIPIGDDIILNLTENYIETKDCIRIFLIPEEQYLKLNSDKTRKEKYVTESLFYIESKDLKNISSTFFINSYPIENNFFKQVHIDLGEYYEPKK
ncbi:MAG: hypothetical protein QM489_02820 [Candidatus Izemoplasma sp.]